MSVSSRNIVLHYQDASSNSDKVYISAIREEFGGKYLVLIKWGRRGNKLQVQIKLHTDDLKQAMTKQRWLAAEKRAEGYVDIEHPLYQGPLSLSDPWLVSYLEESGVVPTRVKKSHPLPNKDSVLPVVFQEEEMICCDNAGYEKNFDCGVEYLCVRDPKDRSMILVYDRFGHQVSVFASRFKKTAEGVSS